VIGSESVLEERVSVISSVIGRRVRVAEGSILRHCHVWDGARIGPGVQVARAIVGREVEIGSNCVIAEGCVLGSGVVLAPDTRIPPGTWVTCSSEEFDEDLDENQDEDEAEDAPRVAEVVPKRGRVVRYASSDLFSGVDGPPTLLSEEESDIASDIDEVSDERAR